MLTDKPLANTPAYTCTYTNRQTNMKCILNICVKHTVSTQWWQVLVLNLVVMLVSLIRGAADGEWWGSERRSARTRLPLQTWKTFMPKTESSWNEICFRHVSTEEGIRLFVELLSNLRYSQKVALTYLCNSVVRFKRFTAMLNKAGGCQWLNQVCLLICSSRFRLV